MKKYLKLILLPIICVSLLVGCQGDKTQNLTKTTRLLYEELPKKEQYLLNVTGNQVLTYNFENLSKDKNYELNLIYEVYKDGEKTREDLITGIMKDEESAEIDTDSLIINLQENKIRYVLGHENGYVSGNIDIDENMDSHTQIHLTNDIDLELGSEVYLYHAMIGSDVSQMISLGTPIIKEDLDKVVKHNKENIFIKLSYKEIQ
ncbi:MAG: hypothetical protein ACRC3Y_08740 [Romboutsia sp.]|uniref:hypothetical protein n=1 Tax=Romboutsia sp. TaxID=1965302 RepID=UPI003F3B4A7B